MKKIKLTLAAFALAFTAFAQDVVIERLTDNTTALITTNGSDDAGVFCADFFTLEEDTTLGNFTFPGSYSSAVEIGDLLTGADLYIYQDLNGSPNANPTTANALVNLTSVQLGAGLELRLVDNIESGFIINVTAANGGSQITLPAGNYWVAFAPAVVGGSAGAGRWNWNGSFTTQTGIFPANESLLIDSDNLFGANATDWTGISSLIGVDFPSFAWTLTSEGTTTPCQSTPAITNPISDYVVCETGSSTVPSGVFDLTSKDAEILNSLENVTLTYHLSLADAESGTSPVASPFETQSTAIWVRATDDTTSNPVCYSVGVFNLNVEPTPDFFPIPLITSADGEIVDGLTEFDLNSYIPEITLGNPDLTVTFHETLSDALNGVGNLPGLYTNLLNPQTIFARVSDNNTGCYGIFVIDLLVVPPPSNNLCENASALSCGMSVQGFDTSFATNTNAPDACGTALDTAPGVWHTLTIPTDGDYNVSVDTFGSVFDTKLGVFSGNCNDLICIGGNDDSGGTAQSKVLFTGAAAQTYYIYVTGFNTSSGEYDINIACEDVLDITENDFVDINIYPNPASDKVTISNPGLLELETISVYDLKGRLMIKNNIEGIESITIDTSILQSATYMIFIESKYRNIIKRLLIE